VSDFRTIEIDFDVHKRIELERRGFGESDNDVLRRLLGIADAEARAALAALQPAPDGRAWSAKGVTLPHGTALRMEYNGRVHTGEVRDGQWMVEGKSFASPSGAAGGVATTKSGKRANLDGWEYWQVKPPAAPGWISILELRRRIERG
jgi:hypothetical protein